jgi:hypothetical protein
MKKINCVLLSLFFLFGLFNSFAQAVAISDTSAILNFSWNSDDFVGNEWYYALNGASADLDGALDNPAHVGGWVTDPAFSLTAQVGPDSLGIAETTSTSANTSAHSKADGIGLTSPPQEEVYTTGDSTLGWTFSPKEDGTYTFTFDYLISHVFSNDSALEGNSGWSTVQLALSHDGNQIGYDNVVVNTEIIDEGFLSITADLSSDQWYYLQGHAYTSAYARSPEQTAPVPEPATIILFSTGIVGLAGITRKKFKK